jgi:hypothetical protein
MRTKKPQNMLERSEGLADWTKHHLHVSDRPSGKSTQLWTSLTSELTLSQQKSENYNSVQCRVSGKIVFGTIQRICLSSDEFYTNSTLILTTIAVKWCMDLDARPHVCAVLLMSVLTLADDLCCTWFIYPIYVGADVREIGNSFGSRPQLSRTMDNVQKHNNCKNYLSVTVLGYSSALL